ncbi:alpha/beta fold hydrolase [Sagittula stellata]|uniref:AB hydrolase-1 domain-containing protein n=1 Tax=Sagittula stellata (strain ATCC 700073 / DSM 11524 / E-37) TaxID=388399 RepID=A3K4U7_SAGS3|nr:alpha/beta hydrolase [Sagittula stellata]EBA07996.1 hypothetical protein SSE37_02045 [Sagittula stellata E-37]
MQENFINVGAIRTRYLSEGSGGTPIVFVHGGTIGDVSSASNAEDFEPLIAEIGKDRLAIAVDRLGQGYTDNPSEDEVIGWTMKGSVQHFIAFLEELGKGPYHLVGHSRGGYVVTRTTLERPDLVASLTIGDSNTVAPGGARNEGIHLRNPHKPGTREAMEFTTNAYYFSPETLSPASIDKKLEILATPKIRKAIARMGPGGYRVKHFLPDLAKDREELFMRLANEPLQRRVQILWAYNDPTAPIEMGYSLFELIAKHQPRTSIHIVNQSGHSLYRERFENFIRVLKDHLEGVTDGC